MTPSKALFRSHLMQQFAAAARHQSRPPLALAAASINHESTRERSSSTSSAHHQFSSASATTTRPCSSPVLTQTSATLTSNQSDILLKSKSFGAVRNVSSEAADNSNDKAAVLEDTSQDTTPPPPSSLAVSLQSLISTRRTQSKFALVKNDDIEKQQSLLKQALDRAIVCAQAAPNHYKTEPFFFKRVIAPSPASFQLSEIASQVVLHKKLQVDPDNAYAHAARKLAKWNEIPAFLVALCENNQQAQETSDEELYKPLPYSPPTTERQLEDYASACAAVQNILLSLHAEGIGTKWATGPVVQTPAFRQFVHANETDRVVGLIMIGNIMPNNKTPRRRFRKEPHALVQDLS